jgi:hypothetical protein
MARKKALGLIKRDAKQIRQAFSKSPDKGRTMDMKVTVLRHATGYNAQMCIVGRGAPTERAKALRAGRSAGRCSVGMSNTPTGAIAKAAQEFAKLIKERK